MTTLQTARASGQAGIESSAQHAEHDAPGWSDRALTLTRWFARIKGPKCRRKPGSEDYELVPDSAEDFTMEEARQWAYGHGLQVPPEQRAWGAVTQRAIREGIIVPTGGYRATVASNGSVRALYRKA